MIKPGQVWLLAGGIKIKITAVSQHSLRYQYDHPLHGWVDSEEDLSLYEFQKIRIGELEDATADSKED